VTRLLVQVNPASTLAGAITEARVRAGAAAFGDGLALSFGNTPDARLLIGKAPLAELGRRTPHLRQISYASAGAEWLIDTDFPPQRQLTNASGTQAPKAAEFTLTAVPMLNNQRAPGEPHPSLPRLLTPRNRWGPGGIPSPVFLSSIQGHIA
jgi:hypothetical protein